MLKQTRTIEIGLITPEKKEEGREQGKPHEAESEQHAKEPDYQNLKHHDKKSTEMGGKKPENGSGRPNLTVFVDPYTGKITGQFNRRKSFFSTVEMLHRFLLAGKNSIGNTIVAFSTLFFLFILITGVVLWWPKNKKIMRQRLRYKWIGGWKRLTHDLHIVTGFYTSLFLLVIVFTGLIMTFPWANKLLFAIAGSKPGFEQPKPPVSTYQSELKLLSVEQILAKNSSKIKDAASYSMRSPQDSTGTFSLNVLPKGAIETAGDIYFIDQFSGKIISIQKFSDKNSAQRARAFVKPIHTGSVYGLLTKIISFIVCLLSLIFPVTGVMMWLNRIKKRPIKEVLINMRSAEKSETITSPHHLL